MRSSGLEPYIRVRVRHPVAFLAAVIDHFAHETFLSLEGDLSHLDVTLVAPISTEPTPILRRNTTWPKEDFVVFVVTPETREPLIRSVLPRVGLRSRVMHVQLASGGRLVCGAYDQFDASCVWIDASIGEQAVRALRDAEIIQSYEFAQKT